MAGCRGGASTTDSREAASEAAPKESPVPSADAPKDEILLLFPGTDDDLLHAEKRSVLAITSPEDRAAQCLEELFRGPSPGLLPAVPDGVRVRQLYILPDGTAYVDLSSEMLNHPWGSTTELQAIYAIVDTLALNVTQIARIGILVDGEPRETLGGHVAIERVFTPDFRYVEESVRPNRPAPEPPPSGTTTGDGGNASSA